MAPSIEHLAKAAEAESKYIYFVLAASGAALGFTLEKHSHSQGLTVSYAALLLATFAWLLSFLCGLRAVHHRLASLNVMANTVQLEQMLHLAKRNLREQDAQVFEKQFADAVQSTNASLTRQGRRFDSYLSWQFHLLMLGAVAYTAFHLLPFFCGVS